MKIALFYNDGFVEFEIALVGLLFQKHDIISVALENREFKSMEQQRFCVDETITDIDIDSIDLLVIPGGDHTPLFENQQLKRFIENLVSRNKKIGGICGGSELLAALGILKGKKCTGNTAGIKTSDSTYKYYSESILLEDFVVVDENIITAQGQAYVEFAAELARQMGLYEEDEEYDEDLRWLKNIR